MKIVEAYKDFKSEGLLMGYSNNFFLFIKAYFIDKIYSKK